ncbi:MAG: hypothetical protein NTZ35_00065 [Ignavibacteriales bacterium]|nr:hypothetical protein [Ignavibacteriales bacterium]
MPCPAGRSGWQHLNLVMSFELYEAFWIKSYFGKMFHVMSPGEGLVTIAVLMLAMWCAVAWLKGERNERLT